MPGPMMEITPSRGVCEPFVSLAISVGPLEDGSLDECLPISAIDASSGSDEAERVDRPAVAAHLEMEVGRRRPAARADARERVAGGDPGARAHEQRVRVPAERLDPAAVVDH